MGNLIGGGGSYGNGGYGGNNYNSGYGGGYGPYRGGRYWSGKMTPQSRPGGGAMGAGLGGGNQGGGIPPWLDEGSDAHSRGMQEGYRPSSSLDFIKQYGDSGGQMSYPDNFAKRRNYSDPLGNPVGGYNIYDGKGGQKFWPDWTPMPGGWSTTAPSQGPGMTVDKTPTTLKPNPDAKYEV